MPTIDDFSKETIVYVSKGTEAINVWWKYFKTPKHAQGKVFSVEGNKVAVKFSWHSDIILYKPNDLSLTELKKLN